MNKGITIVTSEKEDLTKCVVNYQKIFSDYMLENNLMVIEDLCFDNFKLVNKGLYSTVFLLNNHPNIATVSRLLTYSGYNVINSEYQKLNISKIDALLIVFESGIKVPENTFFLKNLDCSDLSQTRVSKSIRHGDMVLLPGENVVVEKYSVERPTYFEEFIPNKCFKAYIANRKIFFNEKIDQKYLEKTYKIFNKILDLLKLEVTSIDFCIQEGEIVILDVNFSPGLLGSEDAVRELAKYILQNNK